jgi:hypothetical protein
MNKDYIIPNDLTRDEIKKRIKEFNEDSKYETKRFKKFFGERLAKKEIQVTSLLGLINETVYYDSDNQFDLRPLLSYVHPEDKPLFIDVIKFVSERFVGDKPASQLTLQQFRSILAVRLAQIGF